ncbi:hypothetical protein ACQUQQ_08680 [Acidithiobacillus ferrooxidans]|uniref:hypothetical protein n=1 Tax=Acidithiobacillus ferrooxidans TaxID=920 RepID=UPI000AE96DE0
MKEEKAELDQSLVTIQSLLFSAGIQRNACRVVSCEIFERVMRDGFSRISRRNDLEDLAADGFRLLRGGVDGAFADWLDVNNHFESACRLFAVYAAQNGIGDDPGILADAMVEFYDDYSAADPATPEPVRCSILTNFRAARDELEKFSDFVVRDLVVPPVSTRLQ